MKRWLAGTSVVISLLLFLGVGVLWIRSYWKSDLIAREDFAGNVFGLQTHPGGIEWSRHPATFVIWQGTAWAPGKGKWTVSSSQVGDPQASWWFFTSPRAPSLTNASGTGSATLTLSAPAPPLPQGITMGVTATTPIADPLTLQPSAPSFSSGSGILGGGFTFAPTTAPSNSFKLTVPATGSFQLAPPVARTPPQPQAPEIFEIGPGIATGASRQRQSYVTGHVVSGMVTGGSLTIGPARSSPRTLSGASYLTLTINSVVWTPPAQHFLGFGYETIPTMPGTLSVATGSRSLVAPTMRVAAPFWFFLVLTATLPALWTAGKLRVRRRVRAGMCAACGYDLRATPGRCPECGKSQ